jgi:excisionase family DNA binding protein
MNLADAIRQAATERNEAAAATADESPNTFAAPQEAPKVTLISQEEPSMKEAPTQMESAAPGNVVRLELVLNPEQLKNLFNSIIANQHSIMTLRDAAQYLRLPSGVVEQLANDGKLPAFQIDGRWRFSHAAIDEWLTLQGHDEAGYDRAVGA